MQLLKRYFFEVVTSLFGLTPLPPCHTLSLFCLTALSPRPVTCFLNGPLGKLLHSCDQCMYFNGYSIMSVNCLFDFLDVMIQVKQRHSIEREERERGSKTQSREQRQAIHTCFLIRKLVKLLVQDFLKNSSKFQYKIFLMTF